MKTKSTSPVRIILAGSIGILLLGGCTGVLGFNRKVRGSGHVVKETRSIQNIKEVVLSEQGNLFIQIGERDELVIEAEDNLQEFLVAETQGQVLELKKLPENVTLNTTRPIRYHLTVKELRSLTVKNSGDVEITEVDTDSFSIRITSSGSVHIGSLYARRSEIELTSSGDLSVDTGEVEDQRIRLSSSGEYDGKNVVCQRAEVRLSSSGDAYLNVMEILTADLSSSGNLYYAGNPKVVYKDSSSSGRAIRLP